jgi:hypothetical protein
VIIFSAQVPVLWVKIANFFGQNFVNNQTIGPWTK